MSCLNPRIMGGTLFLIVFLLILGMFLPVVSQAGDVFNPDDLLEVRIRHLTRESLLRLHHQRVDIDGVWGDTARAYMFSECFEELRAQGYDMVVVSDRKSGPRRPDGYPTWSEVTAELKAVAAAHPEICQLHNIGRSEQGRELWFMKISDNVDVEEDEPEVKYVSTIHGDESVGTELCLNLIHVLTGEYGTDPRMTRMVDEIEIWIMPIMNPDGHVMDIRYNALGTDLNRSFPDRADSPPVNTTEGRPLETQHMMNWSFAHSFTLSASFHTGAVVVNYPYDSAPDLWSDDSASPDDALFVQQSLTYACLNPSMHDSHEFDQGITNGAEWYHIHGGMQDWNYVWMGCNETTIEISHAKQPPYSDIPDIWNENQASMLAYMEWALRGVRGVVTDSMTREPLNATVSVMGIDHEVRTDPDVGDYHRMLVPGRYDLCFSAQGYDTQVIPDVAVGSESALRLDVALVPLLEGDMNNDKRTDLADLIIVLQILAGRDVPLPLDGHAGMAENARIGMAQAIGMLNRAAR